MIINTMTPNKPHGIAALYFEFKISNPTCLTSLMQLFKPLFQAYQGPVIVLFETKRQKEQLESEMAIVGCQNYELYHCKNHLQMGEQFSTLQNNVELLCQQTGQHVLSLTNTENLTAFKRSSKTVIKLQDRAQLLKMVYGFYHAFMTLHNVSFHLKTHLCIALLSAWDSYAKQLGIDEADAKLQHQHVYQAMDSFLIDLMRCDAYGDIVRDLMSKAQGKLNALHLSLSKKRDYLSHKIVRVSECTQKQRWQRDIALINQQLAILCRKGISPIRNLKGKNRLSGLEHIIEGLYEHTELRQHFSSRFHWLFKIKVKLLPSFTRSRLGAIRSEVHALIRETKRELDRTKVPVSAIRAADARGVGVKAD